MNQHSTDAKASQSGTTALRFDVIAGLTAAAVVLPKAMAYATIAGLPVAVGLYTSYCPASRGRTDVRAYNSLNDLNVLNAMR